MFDYKADAALLALKNYEVPPSFLEKSKMDEIRQKDRVIYWDDNVIKYYKRTVGTIGKPYSRYIILRDFGFDKIPIQDKPFKVKAVRLKQRDAVLFLFAMESEKLLKLCYVFRRDMRDPAAYQRLLSSKRLSSIGKFVSQGVLGESGLLANNLILAFEEPGVKFTGSTLNIPAIHCSVWIIDGQHRLYGFQRLDKKLPIDEKEEILKQYPLICVGIRDVRKRKQAMLFREINAYQKKINRNLLLDLFDYLEIDDGKGLLQRIKIVKYHLRRLSCFKNKIKILRTDKGNISLATFVDYQRMKELVNIYGDRKARSILRTYFESVSEVFPEWGHPENYVLAINKGVRMLLTLLHPILKYGGSSKSNFKKCLTALRDSIKSDEDYFKNERYRGKALGAGAPDIVALEQWAKKIQEKIPDFPVEEEMNPEAYPLLKNLEINLRECIKTELGKLSTKWWKQNIPPDIRKNAEERKAKDILFYPERSERHLIDYVDFADYRKIIIKRDNWDKVFKRIFIDREILNTKLRELEDIRNAVMHLRKLGSLDLKKLQLYTQEIIALIKRVQEEKMQVPQANDLDKVIKTVLVISKGEESEESFLVGRQGRYHRNAAEILGFLRRINDHYHITDLGKRIIKASNKEKILLNAVVNTLIFKRFLHHSLKNKKLEWNYDEIGEFILDQIELSEKTARRRAQVIASWLTRIKLAELKSKSSIILKKEIIEEVIHAN